MEDRAIELELSPEQLQQHPVVALMVTLFGSLILAIIVSGIVMWFITIRRLRRGETILKVEPWTPRVWGLLDLVLIAGLVIVAQVVSIKLWAMASGMETSDLRSESDFPLSAMAAGSLSYLVVMFVSVVWLKVRYGVTLAHIGLTNRKFMWNLGVGAVAALLSLPIVYAIMALVSSGLDEQYDHPLLDRMAEEGSASAFLLATFCAVVVAPITEEFLFRVMLQGWLQSLPWSGRNLMWLTGASQEQRGIDASSEDDGSSDAIPLAHIVPGESAVPNANADVYAARAIDDAHPSVANASIDSTANVVVPKSFAAYSVEGEARNQMQTQNENPFAPPDTSPPVLPSISGRTTPPLWPVFISGGLFGMAHYGYGLSFIPLILLGIILGLLYRAKHSIWPSFVVHLVLNSISMIGLGLSMLIKAIAG